MLKTFVIYCPDENIVGFYGLTAAEGNVSALGEDNRKVDFSDCPINHHERHSAVGVAVEAPPTQINPRGDEFDQDWLNKFNASALEIARPILSIPSNARQAKIDIYIAIGMNQNVFNPWRRR